MNLIHHLLDHCREIFKFRVLFLRFLIIILSVYINNILHDKELIIRLVIHFVSSTWHLKAWCTCWQKLVKKLSMQTLHPQERMLCKYNLYRMRVLCIYVVWCQLKNLHGRWRNLWHICSNIRPFCDIIVQML